MDYMRKVIYLKKRENGALVRGQGFGRLEKRGDSLLLHISMQDIPLPGENPAYLICGRQYSYRGFPIGTVRPANSWDFRSRLEDLPGQLILEDICGILVGRAAHYLSGLCPEHAGTLLYDQVDFASESETAVPQAGSSQAEVPRPESPQEESPQVEALQEETLRPEPPRAELPAPDSSQPGTEHGQADEMGRFLQGLSEMYPFEDDEIDWCLQMNPEDFNHFPMEYWHYAKNSFLLQGFYNYRHLVCAHKDGANYVGVPGQYTRKEQYLATRFDFCLFKQIRKKKLSMGDYGYWLRKL